MTSKPRHSRQQHLVDWKKFGKLLKGPVKATRMSYRQLATDLDVISHATLYRVVRGDPCSVEIYLLLCNEFDIDPFAAFKPKD